MKSLTKLLLGKQPVRQGDVWAALDVGSSKVVCFIARVGEDGHPQVVGIGHHLSEGLRNGLVIDMEAARASISAAVENAERMAGESIERVTVGLPGPILASQTQAIEFPLNGREITESDIERILAEGQMMMNEEMSGPTLDLIHTLPVHYTLDGQKGIRDPLGMIGHRLQTQVHLVSALFGPLRTLDTTIKHCRLEVEQFVAAPYASGLAALVEDEMELGCTLIDMGAGTTSISLFNEGQMIYAGGVSVGGAHITNDIARGLTTSLAHAERLKNLYGSAVLSGLDEREIIDVPQVGEEEPGQANPVPKSHLIRIIQPRLEEIFELVRAKLSLSGMEGSTGKRVVLTGGASQMPGVRDMAQKMLDKQVRLGRPLRITRPGSTPARAGGRAAMGLAESTSGPAFSAAAGLVAHAIQPDLSNTGSGFENAHFGFFTRMGSWFKQNM